MKNKALVLALALAVFVTFSAAPSAEAFVLLAPAVAVVVWGVAVVTTGVVAAIDSQKDQSKEVAVNDKRLVLSKNAIEFDNEAEE